MIVQKAPQRGEVWGVTHATSHSIEHWRRRLANSPRAIIHRREEVDFYPLHTRTQLHELKS